MLKDACKSLFALTWEEGLTEALAGGQATPSPGHWGVGTFQVSGSEAVY
jgi:hypothetical protein